MLSFGRKRVVVAGRHDRGQKRLRRIPAVFRLVECALQEFQRRADVSISGILDTGLLLRKPFASGKTIDRARRLEAHAPGLGSVDILNELVREVLACNQIVEGHFGGQVRCDPLRMYLLAAGQSHPVG